MRWSGHETTRGILTTAVVSVLLAAAVAAHALTATPTRTRTPTRTPTPSSAVLFHDDFSGDLSRWEVVTGTWEIIDGELQGIGHGGGVDAWIYAGNLSWTDYAVSTRAHYGLSNVMIVVRSTGHWQNEYRIDFNPQRFSGQGDEHEYLFFRYRNGKSTTLKSGIFNRPIPNPVDVRAEILGNELRLYVDEMFVDSVTDPDPLPAGRFSIGVVWDRVTRFDDVLVTGGGCGNGLVEPERGEECDDENLNASDGCTNACTICGNRVVASGEQCDDGNSSNEDACRNDCQRNVCGDGFHNPATEQCDDGNTSSCDGCSPTCQNEPVGYHCGDGVVSTVCGEECDDGNTSNDDLCRNDCHRNVCGDGYRNPAAEECDDGDMDSCDGCSPLCRVEPDGYRCGDGVVVSACGEECDDGGVCVGGADEGTYCSGPEQCFSGECRAVGGDGCAANCTEESAYPLVFDPATSKITVQTGLFAEPMPVSGGVILGLGTSRESTGSDEIPVAVRTADVSFAPVRLSGVSCTCIRAVDGPGLPEGVSGAGSISCAGLLAGVDVLSGLDHNTNDGDPNCVFGEVETSGPPCVNGICESGVREGHGCGGPHDCDAPHPGVCNGPEEVGFSGTGPAGSARLDLRLESWSIEDGGACVKDCGIPGHGPDCLPCTDDDLQRRGQYEWMLPEFDLRLTTGRAAAEILDANNQRGKNIAEGSRGPCNAGTGCTNPERCWNLATRKDCATGDSGCECRIVCGSLPCSSSATGTPVNCEALTQGVIDTGLAGAVAGLDQPTFGDVVTTFVLVPIQLCGNNALDSAEQCDDGNRVDGDGCDSNCAPTGCGNGVATAGEECDDGNLRDGDGCSALCLAEPTSTPTASPSPTPSATLTRPAAATATATRTPSGTVTRTATTIATSTNSPTATRKSGGGGGGCAVTPAAGSRGSSLLWLLLPLGLLVRRRALEARGSGLPAQDHGSTEGRLEHVAIVRKRHRPAAPARGSARESPDAPSSGLPIP